jgi:hypothetical protein
MVLVAWVAVGISCLSLAMSLYTFRKNQLFKFGETQLNIRVRLNDTYGYIMKAEQDYTILENSELSASANNMLESAYLSHLGIFEECAIMYRDNKLDRESFEQSYAYEIKRLFQDPCFKKHLTGSNGYPCLKELNQKLNPTCTCRTDPSDLC